MIKISRSFCRYSCLLQVYSYLSRKISDYDLKSISNNFLDNLDIVINDTFSILEFVNLLLKEYKSRNNCKNNNIIGGDIFSLDEYSRFVFDTKIFSLKNFDISNNLLISLYDIVDKSKTVNDISNYVSNDDDILNIIDVSPLFKVEYNKNIFDQIILKLGKELFVYLENLKSECTPFIKFCDDIFDYFIKNEDTIKDILRETSENWLEERIFMVEKIIIGLSISEWKVYKTPIQVLINEYVNLSKIFCGAKSSLFINGLLDPILKRI